MIKERQLFGYYHRDNAAKETLGIKSSDLETL
jgi:hypothetical protein